MNMNERINQAKAERQAMEGFLEAFPEAIDDAKQQRFEEFLEELTILSHRFGIALETCGGLTILESNEEFAELDYINKRDDEDGNTETTGADASSGDLFPFIRTNQTDEANAAEANTIEGESL